MAKLPEQEIRRRYMFLALKEVGDALREISVLLTQGVRADNTGRVLGVNRHLAAAQRAMLGLPPEKETEAEHIIDVLRQELQSKKVSIISVQSLVREYTNEQASSNDSN